MQVLGHATNDTNKSEAFFQVQFCTTEELIDLIDYIIFGLLNAFHSERAA